MFNYWEGTLGEGSVVIAGQTPDGFALGAAGFSSTAINRGGGDGQASGASALNGPAREARGRTGPRACLHLVALSPAAGEPPGDSIRAL